MQNTRNAAGRWPDPGELGRMAYNSPDPLMMLDEDGVILAVNPAWFDVLGWHEDDLLDHRFFEFIHDDDLEHTTDRWQEVVAGMPVVDERNRWVTATGGWCWLSWSWKVDTESGHVFSAGRDVTSHMDVYVRATEGRQLLATAEVLADVGAWEWTSSPDVVSMSEHMRALLGIAHAHPVTSDQALELLHPDDRERVRQLLLGAVQRGGKVDTEFRIAAVDGDRVLAMHAEANRDEAGTAHLHGAVQDITERFRLAALKDAFLAAASHELRTPLTLIKGAAETLVRLRATDELQRTQMQGALVRNVGRLEHLMGDLLDFGALQRGDMQLQPVRFDLAALLHDLVAASDVAARATIDGPGSLTVPADRVIVERIVQNLLDNAAKYAPSGPVTVSYGQRGEMVRLSVADAGPGVEAAEAERIFEPFYRVPDDRPRPGTGIGLALVAEFARAHHGRAWVEPHQPGAEFIVEIRSDPDVV